MTERARESPIRAVFVMYKKSAYQLYMKARGNGKLSALLEAKDTSIRRLLEAHQDHVDTIEHARQILRRLGVKAVFRYRSDVEMVEACDLVLTLGGDGTLLMASHLVGPDTPVLAINTAPKDSVGFFCGGTRDNLEATLEAAITGRLKPVFLQRMCVERDGEQLSCRVLNDALFCHASPAGTSRYLIQVGETEEEHKSSGVWVGPATGSTAAVRSAGGRLLPLTSRKIQYVVREPYAPRRSKYQHLKGVVDPGDSLVLRSKIPNARLYLDGPHREYEVGLGTTVRMYIGDQPLKVLGLEGRERRDW